jgi:hypothetical protein
MHYELWALNTGNLIRDYDNEAEALAMVRDLIADGWDATDLGMNLEWDDGEDGADSQLPPALSGAALVARAARQAAQVDPKPGMNGKSASVRHTREAR